MRPLIHKLNTMKLLILTLVLSLATASIGNAQTRKPTTEEKQLVNPIVDEGFTQWGRSWSMDKYVGRSAKIATIKIDEDYGDTEVDGDFEYRRFGVNFSGTFTAKISSEGKLVTIRYIDANGMRGSKNF